MPVEKELLETAARLLSLRTYIKQTPNCKQNYNHIQFSVHSVGMLIISCVDSKNRIVQPKTSFIMYNITFLKILIYLDTVCTHHCWPP